MSIRNRKYLPLERGEEVFAYCIEDPIVPYMNPGYSVLTDTKQYRRILEEYQKGYNALSSNDLSYFKIPYKC